MKNFFKRNIFALLCFTLLLLNALPVEAHNLNPTPYTFNELQPDLILSNNSMNVGTDKTGKDIIISFPTSLSFAVNISDRGYDGYSYMYHPESLDGWDILSVENGYKISIPASAKPGDSYDIKLTLQYIELQILREQPYIYHPVSEIPPVESEIFTINIVDESEEENSSITIDSANFPDEIFRNHVKSNYDTNGDGSLSAEEIKEVAWISLDNMNIQSLKGIEYFTSLESLNCSNNKISELDISSLKNLLSLSCNNNNISKLDVSKCLKLEDLFCSNNNLRDLDLSKCTNLDELGCENNNLKSLDISNLSKLRFVYCSNNDLDTLIVDNCTNLGEIVCSNNNISELDVSTCPNLFTLSCSNNNLKTLDVSKCTKLRDFSCYDNNIYFLELSECISLKNMEPGASLIALNMGNSPEIANQLKLSTIFSGSTVFDFSNCDFFDVTKVSNIQRMSLEGKVFTLNNNWGGSYNYDCGNGNVLTVTLRYKEGEEVFIPSTPKPAPNWQFNDVSVNPGNWKYEAVKYVTENGIMNGTAPNEFQPDAPLTRAMFATMLYRMAGQPTVTFTNKFPDVPAGKWYSDAVIWASSNGVVDGYGNGNFGTNDSITREQIAKMLMEFGKVQGYDVSQSADFSTFADASSVSGWADSYMKWAVGSGMITGKTIDGKLCLAPKGNATRAESATMLMRFMEKY